MKSLKFVYWISTGIIALFNIPGIFFMNSQQAIDGTKHLGLPQWFHTEITIGKCIGGLILILPFFPKRIKEWAYVAFGIDILSATIALLSVNGMSLMSLSPLLVFGVLLCSYITFHKITDPKSNA